MLVLFIFVIFPQHPYPVLCGNHVRRTKPAFTNNNLTYNGSNGGDKSLVLALLFFCFLGVWENTLR